MTTATVTAFILQAAVFLAAVIVVLRHNAARQDAHSNQLAALAAQGQHTARLLIETAQADREKHRAEVQALLQRIQAPEQAIVQHQADTSPPASDPAYPLDDTEQAEAQDVHLLATQTLEMIRAAEADLTDQPVAA